MVMEALVYILTLLFGVSTVIIIKNKRYKVVPFICLDIILTFAGFAITSFVILFVGNEALEALLIMSVFGLFLFLLGVNDIYAVFCCNQKIEAVYCGYNSYPGRYGITSYAPVFEYVCNGTAYHEQTTLTVPYRLLRRMTEGNTYPIYILSKHPVAADILFLRHMCIWLYSNGLAQEFHLFPHLHRLCFFYFLSPCNYKISLLKSQSIIQTP